MSKEEARQRWAAADRAAVVAETKAAAIGQAASDPRVAIIFKEAADLRGEADGLFREMAGFADEDEG
jgi:hypothetical protein